MKTERGIEGGPGAKRERGMVVFRLAGQEHALDMAHVQEVLTSADILPLADTPPFVIGVLKLRDRIVPVVDLRARLKLPEAEWTYETCIVVVRLDQALAGLVVDTVTELLSVPEDAVEHAPDMVSGSRAEFYEGAMHLEDRFLMVIDPGRVVAMESREMIERDSLSIDTSPGAEGQVRRLGGDTHLARFLAEEMDQEWSDSGGLAPAEDIVALGRKAFALRKIIAFDLGDELYGADIADVAEILEPLPVRPLPNVPDHVLGLVNLRGSILPVVDARVRFGLSLKKAFDRESRIIVMRRKGMLLGLVVDRMWELLRLPPESFQPPPPDAAGIDAEFLKEVGRVGDRLLIVLDVDRLVRETSPNPARIRDGEA